VYDEAKRYAEAATRAYHRGYGLPVRIARIFNTYGPRMRRQIRNAAGGSSRIVNVERPVDDPELRRPNISLARRLIEWEPVVPLEDGLARTIEWAKASWS
jgi:dTDP-glucose 4,6-dehydratase